MLYDAADDPARLTPTELREAYEAQLRAVVSDRDVESVADDTDVDADVLEALVEGSVPQLRVEDAASVLALDDDRPAAEAILLELRDHLLLAMTTGVVDVDTLASNVDLGLSGQEIQQALEGRTPMTLAQLAAIQQYLAERNDR